MAEAVFIAGADGGFTATDLARGPWDPDAQHGGAPAALLMHAFEALPAAPGLLIARVSYEFIRPAPLGALTVRADVIRPGRRVQLLEGSLIGPDLTLYIDRPPVGEWVCVDARTSIAEDGVGIADSVLYDERGRVGRATQALLIAPQ